MKLKFFYLLLLHGSLFANSLWHEINDYEPLEYKKFVLVICSYNNATWYKKNLDSAFDQNYPKDCYRIIFIDESRDGTAGLVEEYVTARDEWGHVTLIKNETWQSVMHNHYKAAYLCDDDEIIVHLDGDDFLKHDKVLWFLNKVYNKWDVWLTYGQYENWPVPELGFSCEPPAHIVERNAFREFGFWYSHPRTFYAWLFKKIALKDLIWKGSFIPTTPAVDYMFMIPMMEMAGQGHYKFIPDALYLYNRSNSLSTCNMPIKVEIPPARAWACYQPLCQADSCLTKKRNSKQADLVLLSFDDPDALIDFIAQRMPLIKDIGTTLVLYHASCIENENKYQELNLPINMMVVDTDKHATTDILNCLRNDYCVVIADVTCPVYSFAWAECVYELERTQAKIFFLNLTKQSFIPCNEKINYTPFPNGQLEYRLAFLSNGIAAWQFAYEPYVWQDPMLDSIVLLNKNDLQNGLPALLQDFSRTSFKNLLYEVAAGDRDIGLLFVQ